MNYETISECYDSCKSLSSCVAIGITIRNNYYTCKKFNTAKSTGNISDNKFSIILLGKQSEKKKKRIFFCILTANFHFNISIDREKGACLSDKSFIDKKCRTFLWKDGGCNKDIYDDEKYNTFYYITSMKNHIKGLILKSKIQENHVNYKTFRKECFGLPSINNKNLAINQEVAASYNHSNGKAEYLTDGVQFIDLLVGECFKLFSIFPTLEFSINLSTIANIRKVKIWSPASASKNSNINLKIFEHQLKEYIFKISYSINILICE